MSQQLETIRFRSKSPELFAGQVGVVDQVNFTIRGVSCITSDCEAEGHSLFVDKTTLTQLHDLSMEMGQVPVTIDHDGGVDDIDGWLQNFRVDGDKLRADWVLLESHPKTVTMMERASKQPKTFGLSFAFKGDPKGTKVGNRQCARAEQVMSCDVVKRAAANKGGLFSAKEGPTEAELKLQIIALARAASVDSREFNVASKTNLMADQNSPTAEPTLAQVLAEIKGLAGRLDSFEQVQSQLVDHVNQWVDEGSGIDRDFLAALNDASDEELSAYNQQNNTNISRQEIDAAVGEYNASLGGEAEGQENNGDETGTQQSEGAGATNGAANGAAAGAAVGAAAGSAAFSEMSKRLVQLETHIKRTELAKKTKEEEIQFAEIGGKIQLIAQQRDELLKFSQECVAKIEALEMHVKTGTRPVKAGVDSGVRLFHANGNGELSPWQLRVKAIMLEAKCTEAQAITLSMKEPNGQAIYTAHLQALEAQPLHA